MTTADQQLRGRKKEKKPQQGKKKGACFLPRVCMRRGKKAPLDLRRPSVIDLRGGHEGRREQLIRKEKGNGLLYLRFVKRRRGRGFQPGPGGKRIC